MGKNSLIKATDKKKSKVKNEEEVKKTKPQKGSTKTTEKSATRASSAKSAKTSAPVKTAVPRTVSIKDLVMKKFEPLGVAPKPRPGPGPKADIPDAPPYIVATTPEQVARVRKLLALKFDMKTIKAAAVQPPEPLKKIRETPPSEPDKPVEGAPDNSSQSPLRPAPDHTISSQEPEIQTASENSMEDVKPIVTASPFDEPQKNEADPVKRGIKYALAGFALLVIIIVAASVQNSSKYYIQAKNEVIEIQRGTFSPTGRRFFMVLHGVAAPTETKSVYTRADIFPMIFDYYLTKADDLLDASGLPDYAGIKAYVTKAAEHAVTARMHDAVSLRLNNIDRMALVYKADVAISQDTEASLEKAYGFLGKAAKLTNDPAQTSLLNQKMDFVRERRAAIKTQTAIGSEQGE